MKVLARLKQVAIALDQLVNTLIGLFMKDGGWADETISARAWRMHLKSKNWNRVRKIFDFIFRWVFWEKDHCQLSYVSEQLRLQTAPEYRKDGTY